MLVDSFTYCIAEVSNVVDLAGALENIVVYDKLAELGQFDESRLPSRKDELN